MTLTDDEIIALDRYIRHGNDRPDSGAFAVARDKLKKTARKILEERDADAESEA